MTEAAQDNTFALDLPDPPYDEVIRFRNAALSEDYPSIVNYINLYGAKIINRQDAAGCTSLMYAALRNNVKILKFLLENGANTEIQSVQGHTARTLATRDHRTETANLLEQWVIKQAQMKQQQEEDRIRSHMTEARINTLKEKRAPSPFIRK